MAKGKKGGRPQDPMSNSKTMGREGMKIIRNIAFGSFNIYNDGQIFRNLNFVRATMEEVDKVLMETGIIINAIHFAYSNSDDANVMSTLHKYKKKYEGYMLIRNQLYSIIATNGDTGFLYVLANRLPAYKYNI